MSFSHRARLAVPALMIVLAASGLGEILRAAIGLEATALNHGMAIQSTELPTGLHGWDGLALLGGFREALADLIWIRMAGPWEKSDRPDTMRSIRLATQLNPMSLYFLFNGARIVAYDMAAWRIQDAEALGYVPQVEKLRIGRQQGHQALELLATADVRFPGNPSLEIEKAQIELHALQEPRSAAARLVIAASCPGAPPYCIRIAAELLRREGHTAEAHRLLKQRLQSLAIRVERGETDRLVEERTIILSRIATLERDMEAIVHD